MNKKIAIVHDWLTEIGGAERVLKALHSIFPEAPIYTLFYNPGFTKDFLPGAEIRPASTQKLFSLLNNKRLLAPFLPSAVESFDLRDFDVVISSSPIYAKGLILRPQTKHICYCYSPTRQLWDWHSEYGREKSKINKLLTEILRHCMRIWDRHTSSRVDRFVAISNNVKSRISKYYHRDSIVVYPPVSDFASESGGQPELPKGFDRYYLIVSRLFPHKNVKIAISAFNRLNLPLIIAGDGPQFNNLKKIAGKNVLLLGRVSDSTASSLYKHCSAFVMAQEEDFGLTPLEAMRFGKPVLALKRGGALEYIEESVNGEFFEDPTLEVLADGVRRISEKIGSYNPEIIMQTAARFNKPVFEEKFKALINEPES
ncbi:MAG: hypothetical protein CEN90_115 [Parcubacteria group bacterium Licking1014_17]|nr:MAG: hypothetical protein CEN90_115 [Parcubacteria group bacterium Licking1014_17]